MTACRRGLHFSHDRSNWSSPSFSNTTFPNFPGVSDLLFEVLHRVKEDRTILHTLQRRKANWIGHRLRRNCFLKHVIERKVGGRIEVTGRRERRREQLMDDLTEKRRYWKLKQEALDRTLWRTHFGRGY